MVSFCDENTYNFVRTFPVITETKKKNPHRMRNQLLSAAGEADLFVVQIENAHGNET